MTEDLVPHRALPSVDDLPWTVHDIERILPHRDPFLFVDRIDALTAGDTIVGQRTWGPSEARIIGPDGRRGVPAAYLTESMAQVGAILVLARPENAGKLIYFLRIDRVRFRRPVRAGETLVVDARVKQLKSKTGTLLGVGRVDGRVVAEGTMMFALSERGEAT